MDRIGQLIKNLDEAEASGLSLEDESNRLKSARFHKGAYDEFTKKFESEQDPDEKDFLKGRIDFHRSRLTALLG